MEIGRENVGEGHLGEEYQKVVVYSNKWRFVQVISDMSKLFLPSILTHSQRSHHPFILLQSSAAQSCLPLLRKVINGGPGAKRVHTLVFCFLHPYSSLIDERNLVARGGTIEAFDHTGSIPGYADSWKDPCGIILEAVEAGEFPFVWNVGSVISICFVAPAGPLNVIFDSVDTLASDLESTSQAFKFLHAILVLVKARPSTFIQSHRPFHNYSSI